jgi:transglutaminase-like putative cysteine protease
MLFKKLTLILFLIIFSNANAQKFELGKVSVAELQEKEHPKDPSASAAILFKKGDVRFEYIAGTGFDLITEVKMRIKIYKKEGYDWANQAVRYYADLSSREKVYFSDAVTYNLVGGKIEKTKLKSDGEFDEKINKYWNTKKITMPNVKEGSVIEYEYEIHSPRNSIRDWYFQSSIPVNYSEYVTTIPEYYVYTTNQKGYIFPKVTVGQSAKSNMYTSGGYDTTTINNSKLTKETLDYQEKFTTYTAANLPAMTNEAFVNNIMNYTSSISYELSKTQFPNSLSKSYSTNWESVVKTIYDFDNFGVELNKSGYFEDDINTLLSGLNDPNEKIYAIFNFVKTKVKWNEYYGYSCDEGVRKAYQSKTGNVAEINLMLTAMLRYAGINANPVLISTRSNGVALFPTTDAFNYVIAAAETPDGLLLLDATELYSLPNILPLRDLNWYGRLIRKDGTSAEVDLMSNSLSVEAINMSIAIRDGGFAEGKVRRQLTKQEALAFRREYLAINKDSYTDALESENNNIEINDYVRENDLDLSKPIIESYLFKDTKDVEVINGKIYISPLLFLTATENPFKQEAREYPVDFGYPTQTKYNINIEIPEGYVVESMPKPAKVVTGSDIGTFNFVIVNTDNKLQVVITSTINKAIVPADFYPVLKGFYQQMIEKQNEKIVLKKI